MLVPAMAFAWWLVSVSSAGAHAPTAGTTNEASGPAVQPAPAAQQDADDETAPVEPAAEGTGSASSDDTSGERVPLKLVTTGIVRVAKTFLDLPMGAERTQNIDGRRYLFVLERHYHPPGFVGGPHGWHKGVTAYELR